MTTLRQTLERLGELSKADLFTAKDFVDIISSVFPELDPPEPSDYGQVEKLAVAFSAKAAESRNAIDDIIRDVGVLVEAHESILKHYQHPNYDRNWATYAKDISKSVLEKTGYGK